MDDTSAVEIFVGVEVKIVAILHIFYNYVRQVGFAACDLSSSLTTLNQNESRNIAHL